MKYPRLLVLLFVVLALHTWAQTSFTAAQLKEDLLFYKAKLAQYHPNLYLYSSKEQVDAFFDSLTASIATPMGEAEFYHQITRSSSLIQDGHTLILPSNGFTTYHNAHSKFLPLQVGLSDRKLYLNMNCTSTRRLPEGIIIDSINGVASENIVQSLLDVQVRDGRNPSYALWILDMYFREYYSYHFGHPDTFRIAYTSGRTPETAMIPALMKDSIFQYRQLHYPLVYPSQAAEKGIYLTQDTSGQVAILTIKDFHNEVLKSEYNQHFKKEIDAAFHDIASKQTPNLIIDLRDNQGGDVENGVRLLKHLISRPFAVVQGCQKIQRGALKKSSGASMGLHKPHTSTYSGQIYVLLNGGSFSNSIIVSSCLRTYTQAIFVGTESGGNPHVLAGDAKSFELPHTRIRVDIPTKRFVMTSLANNNGSGLAPDIAIERANLNSLQPIDRQLETLLTIIRQSSTLQKRQ